MIGKLIFVAFALCQVNAAPQLFGSFGRPSLPIREQIAGFQSSWPAGLTLGFNGREQLAGLVNQEQLQNAIAAGMSQGQGWGQNFIQGLQQGFGGLANAWQEGVDKANAQVAEFVATLEAAAEQGRDQLAGQVQQFRDQMEVQLAKGREAYAQIRLQLLEAQQKGQAQLVQQCQDRLEKIQQAMECIKQNSQIMAQNVQAGITNGQETVAAQLGSGLAALETVVAEVQEQVEAAFEQAAVEQALEQAWELTQAVSAEAQQQLADQIPQGFPTSLNGIEDEGTFSIQIVPNESQVILDPYDVEVQQE